jgi:hypothetical protein
LNAEITDRVKLLLAYTGAGIIFSLLINLSTTQLSERLGLGVAESVGGIVTQLLTGDPMAILMAFLTTVIFGVLIWVFGFVGSKVKSFITHEKVNLSVRPKLLAFFIIGALGVAMFGILDEALLPFNVSTNVVDLPNDLLNPVGLLLKIVAFAIYGALAIWLGTHFTMAEKILPEQAKKI